jgi:hypothetical protein
MVSREATFAIQFLSSLPAQILAIVIPAAILWKAGLKYPEQQTRSFYPEKTKTTEIRIPLN